MSTTTTMRPPQWVLDLNNAPPKAKTAQTIDPPGYSGPASTKAVGKSKNQAVAKERKMPTTDEMDTLKMKKAWEVAIAPAKQLPMSAIGMYMSGNSLQIFSIMMVFMLFKNPFTAIMNVQGQFARFESEGNASKLLGTKLVFIVTNLLSVALGLWKVNGMGLLPYVDRHWFTRDILTI